MVTKSQLIYLRAELGDGFRFGTYGFTGERWVCGRVVQRGGKCYGLAVDVGSDPGMDDIYHADGEIRNALRPATRMK